MLKGSLTKLEYAEPPSTGQTLSTNYNNYDQKSLQSSTKHPTYSHVLSEHFAGGNSAQGRKITVIQQTQQWTQKSRFVRKEGGTSVKNNLLKIEQRESNKRKNQGNAAKSTPFQLYQQSSIKVEQQKQNQHPLQLQESHIVSRDRMIQNQPTNTKQPHQTSQ